MDSSYVYTVVCHKSWTSFRPGSVTDRHGTFATIDDANTGLFALRHRLEDGVEEDGWTGGQIADGRWWLNCDDWGHEELYKLRIEKKPVQHIQTIPPHLRALSDAGHHQPNIGGSEVERLIDQLPIGDRGFQQEVLDRLLESHDGMQALLDRLQVDSNIGLQMHVADRLLEQNNGTEELFRRLPFDQEEFQGAVLGGFCATEEGTEQLLQHLPFDDQGFQEVVVNRFEGMDDEEGNPMLLARLPWDDEDFQEIIAKKFEGMDDEEGNPLLLARLPWDDEDFQEIIAKKFEGMDDEEGNPLLLARLPWDDEDFQEIIAKKFEGMEDGMGSGNPLLLERLPWDDEDFQKRIVDMFEDEKDDEGHPLLLTCLPWDEERFVNEVFDTACQTDEGIYQLLELMPFEDQFFQSDIIGKICEDEDHMNALLEHLSVNREQLQVLARYSVKKSIRNDGHFLRKVLGVTAASKTTRWTMVTHLVRQLDRRELDALRERLRVRAV
ncbi:hypothetical protein F4780DRAFT_780065 [Xylariomycetidae sp. FL0641]|nr:hypothetical protein F4780DRAFT_780065 [Xylariomycetidae sp. FL0641]